MKRLPLPPGAMSLRELARQLDVDPKAVRNAIKTGRLQKCVAYRWHCNHCEHRWVAVGLGPDDPGDGAMHNCAPFLKALSEAIAEENVTGRSSR